MAAHHDEELSKKDELIKKGDDLVKIELYKSALEYFNLALEESPNDKEILKKIKNCQAKIRKDTVKIGIIVPVLVAVIAVLYYLLK